MDFDTLFMNEAYLYALKSKDPSTQVGANIVSDGPKRISIMKGYNGPLTGFDDNKEGLFVKPYKNFAMEHAERNAIFNCAKMGFSCDGCTIYVTTFLPCAECARAIIQSGIKRVVVHNKHAHSAWAESNQYALEFFKETNVEVVYWDGDLVIASPVKFAGNSYEWKNKEWILKKGAN